MYPRQRVTVFLGHVFGQMKGYCIRYFGVSLSPGLSGLAQDTDEPSCIRRICICGVLLSGLIGKLCYPVFPLYITVFLLFRFTPSAHGRFLFFFSPISQNFRFIAKCSKK